MTIKITLHKSILATSIALLVLSGNAFAKSGDKHKMHQLYQDNCASCHGSDHGGYLAPALNSDTLKGRSPTALRTLIMTGSFETLMPPFFGRLSDSDIGESLFLRKLVLGIPAQASGKNLTRPLMPSAPRFVLVTMSRPNKGSEHRLQMT